MKIIGLMRFSVVTGNLKPFRKTRDLDLDDALATILSPDRLRTRLSMFRALCLPSLDVLAARHDGFKIVMLTSTELPGNFRDDIEQIAASRLWIEINPVHPTADLKPALRAAVADAGEAFVFRLDDDDGLAPSFIDAVLSQRDSDVVAFDTGFVVQRVDAEHWRIQQREYTFPTSMGLGRWRRKDDDRTIYELGNHVKLDENYQVHHCADRPYWLQGSHAETDTSRDIASNPVSIRAACAILQENFPEWDCAAMLEAMPYAGLGSTRT